jgi:hypothetical protein
MTDGSAAGKVVKVLQAALNEKGDETNTLALALSAPGGEMPVRVADGMEGGGLRVAALSSCKSWKSATCDFSPAFHDVRHLRQPFRAVARSQQTDLVRSQAETSDESEFESYSKCNFTSGKCVLCDHLLDPDCVYTTEYCHAAEFTMCKTANITDFWRGNAISKGFKRGEWSVDIKEKTVSIGFQPLNGTSSAYGAEQVWHASKKLTLYNGHPTGIQINFTAIPTESERAAALGVKVRCAASSKNVF